MALDTNILASGMIGGGNPFRNALAAQSIRQNDQAMRINQQESENRNKLFERLALLDQKQQTQADEAAGREKALMQAQFIAKAIPELKKYATPTERAVAVQGMSQMAAQMGIPLDQLTPDHLTDQQLDMTLSQVVPFIEQKQAEAVKIAKAGVVGNGNQLYNLMSDNSIVPLGIFAPDKKPQVQVNVDNSKDPGLPVEIKALAEGRATKYQGIQNAALSAQDMNATIDQMVNMDVESGALEPIKNQAARLFNAVGVDGDKLLGANVANAQSFNAVSGKLLADALLLQKGPQTDKDAERIKATLPQIGNEKTANVFIMLSLKAMNNRKIEMADFYQTVLERDGNLKEADKEWRQYINSTPLVSDSVRDKDTGLPMFYYDFKQKARSANPGASDNEIISAWRKLSNGS